MIMILIFTSLLILYVFSPLLGRSEVAFSISGFEVNLFKGCITDITL